MGELISDPRYWERRLREAERDPVNLHHAIFKCPLERWRAIEAKHRQILAKRIGQSDSILDAGCGWGRLLTLLPVQWCGVYLGVDIAPAFLLRALDNPNRFLSSTFVQADLRDLSSVFLPGKNGGKWDWAVLISIRPMVKRHLGDAEWGKMEAELRRVAKRLLYLEYDPDDEGSVE